jgi:hypothetical protein
MDRYRCFLYFFTNWTAEINIAEQWRCWAVLKHSVNGHQNWMIMTVHQVRLPHYQVQRKYLDGYLLTRLFFTMGDIGLPVGIYEMRGYACARGSSG